MTELVEDRGGPVLSETLLPMDVTSAPAGIVKHAQLDVALWKSILSHPVVLMQGVLASDAVRGTTLFSLHTSPRALKSDKQKSILCHLSEMFTQWNGTIIFELVFTLPIFVTTKIVFAYLPFPYTSTAYSASMLAGLQNSVVANPSNQSRVVLRVPFIATTNWLGTADPSGEVCSVLLEPLVFSMDYQGGLPWTLFVYADPNDFNFRYILPPLLEVASTTGQTNTITFSDMYFASSSSSSGYSTEVSRAATKVLVTPSSTSTARSLETLMMIPRSRVEYVMQKVRGQFPTGQFGSEVIASMFTCPTFSFSSYVPDSLTPYDVYPVISYPFAAGVHHYSSLTSVPDYGTPASEYLGFPVIFELNSEKILQKVWIRVTQQQFEADLLPRKTTCVLTPSDWKGAGGWGGAPFQYDHKYSASGFYYHCWHNFEYANGTKLDPGVFTFACLAMAWRRTSRANQIADYLRQIDSAPSEVTHLALYTTMSPEQAATFSAWLTTQDNTSPPTFILGHSISFSCSQAPLSFNDGRLVATTNRGIVWRLFKLFRGDETKWYAWLVKALDVVVDALIGAFLGRSDTAQVVPIGRGSPIRVEPVGAYNPSVISSYSDRVALEAVSKERGVSLISALVRAQGGSGADIEIEEQQDDVEPVELVSPVSHLRGPVSDPSGLTSRSSSRHSAKFPTSRRAKHRRFFHRR